MKYFLIFCFFNVALVTYSAGLNLFRIEGLEQPGAENTYKADSLPEVLVKNHADLFASRLRFNALSKFAINELPNNLKDWEVCRTKLKAEIIGKAGVVIDHKLALNIKETGVIRMKGYSIKKITFQTRPGVYATANLYVPDGKGPFPAVIFMIGHWPKGKIDPVGPQLVGHSLALNGYVCLSIDPWGAGERTTTHGVFEDHGCSNNLGLSLMNIGETLMGVEISDNMRGVDLLCSLSYVDSKNIGATGASGGGNQTMWLTSLDDRIKAGMPVVSAGTFESYIMGTPCICEVFADAFNIAEEAGVLALVAPRAIKMCNHNKEENHAFYPSEMIRSYTNAKSIFRMYGVENNIAYQLFDLSHGYHAEDREAMLGWFDLHLKGIGTGVAKKEIPFEVLPEEKLMVFAKGQRDANVIGTVEYCKKRGQELRNDYLNARSFDLELKRNKLKDILGISEKSVLDTVYEFQKTNGWSRFALGTSDGKLIPLLVRPSSGGSKEYVIVSNPEGKNNIPHRLIDQIIQSGKGIAIVDLSGTGEAASTSTGEDYAKGKLRIISLTELWFGRTILGEWVKELNVVTSFLISGYQAEKIQLDGTRETGLAGLFFGATGGKVDTIILRDAPVSYLIGDRESIDFYSMAVHLNGILNWGDISLATALTGKNIQFINPLTFSGKTLDEHSLNDCQTEFNKIRLLCKQPGNTIF
jgi:hypothetical protein